MYGRVFLYSAVASALLFLLLSVATVAGFAATLFVMFFMPWLLPVLAFILLLGALLFKFSTAVMVASLPAMTLEWLGRRRLADTAFYITLTLAFITLLFV